MRIAYVLIALLVLGACSAPKESAGPQDSGAQAAPQDTAAPSPDAPSQDASKEFNALFAKRNLQWKIAYDMKSDAGGQKIDGQLTQYLKGEDRFRTDMTYEGTETRTYMASGTFTTCMKSDGAWSCYKITPSETDDSETAQDWENEYEENQTDYRIVADGTKTVAGVNAQCYKVTEMSNTDATVRYCFSSDGAPLYISIVSEGYSTEMIATSYSKSVSDSDFTPPAAAQDIGAMYGAGGTAPAGGAGGNDPCAYCNYLSGSQKDECLASC